MTAPPPQRTRKLIKITTSGKRRWIGRDKFYKKYLDHFLIRSNLRSQGVKKVKFSQNRAIFAIISLTVLASRIVRQPNDSPGYPLSICALRLAVSLIL